jgi:hypothetical protein
MAARAQQQGTEQILCSACRWSWRGSRWLAPLPPPPWQHTACYVNHRMSGVTCAAPGREPIADRAVPKESIAQIKQPSEGAEGGGAGGDEEKKKGGKATYLV